MTMSQIAQGHSDSNEWSRGNGEFYVASVKTTTNRKTELISSQQGDSQTYLSNNPFPDSDGAKGTFMANHSNDDAFGNNPNTKNTSAIHVDVRQSYGAVEVPIPPRSQHSGHSLQRGSETRVVSKLNLPPLASPTARNPGRSHSSDVLQNSRRYRNTELIDTMQRTSLRDRQNTMHRNQSLQRRRCSRRRHHHHCCHHNRSPSRSKYYAPNTGTLQFPVALQPAYMPCPLCQNGYTATPYSNLNITPQTPVILQSYPMLASPTVSTHYSLPRGYYRQPIQNEPSGWTTGTMPKLPPTFPRNGNVRTFRQSACVCCPGGIHQFNQAMTYFPFDNELDPEETPMRHMTPTKSRISRDMLDTMLSKNQAEQIRSQHISRQMAAADGPGDQSSTDTLGRKAQKTPNEFVIPITDTKDRMTPVEYSTTNEFSKSYMSQQYTNAVQIPGWYPDSDVKIHGEVMREDGFPLDYVDLIEGTMELINGDEDTDDPDALQTPDKLQVIELVRRTLETSVGSAQVASTLKAYMDAYFKPAWNVVAGTGAYGSNIASISGQMLHFKAFRWAFLLWKTTQE